MAAESTAVNALIHLVQARRLDPDEDPVPDLFSTAPPKSIAQRTIGMPADPRPMAPAVVPPAPPRVASGTKPPPIADATIVPIQQSAPSKPAVVEHDDEQTALWDSNAQVETAPAVPAIAPHVATVISHHGAQPAVPSILRGPVAPAPDPRVMEAARAAHAAAQRAEPVSTRHGRPTTDPRVDAAAAARAAQQRMPVAAHPVALSPQYPAIAIDVSNPHLPHLPRTPTAAPAPYLVARELMTSAVRSWGTLVVVCVLALGVGVYLAIASKSDDQPTAPTDRDRTIAIMNGTAQPEPETVVEAPAPTAVPEVMTAYKPLDDSSAEPAKPTAEPIEDVAAEEAATDEEANDEIDIAAIEIETETETPTTRPAKKRAARSARAARKAKSIATKIEKPTRGDPVLAILAEKPKAAARAERKKEEPKKAKPVKEASLANATEIAAARGAAPTKGTGKVAISSDKPALIFVDGRPTGKSAPSAFVMPAGDHQITLLDPATKKAKTATVQIAANKTVSIRKDFN